MELVYCAGGERAFTRIAIELGYTNGARLPDTVYHPPLGFADQNWELAKKDPTYRAKYMQALATHKPRLATVQDLEHPDQLDDILSWAVEASGYVSEAVLIIPKYAGVIDMLPRALNGKEIRLAYSVPTKHGKTEVNPSEFRDYPVHLLGGSPVQQLRYSRALNVVSVDGNQAKLFAHKMSIFLNRPDRYRPQLSSLGYKYSGVEAQLLAFRISMVNITAMWLGCIAWLRPALPDHIPAIKQIAYQYPKELGFVNIAALQESIDRGGLWVACIGQRVVGFVNYRTRKDGVSVVYEIAAHRDFRGVKIGAALLSAVPLPRRLKCTTDNPANDFYAHSMQLIGTEQGRKRELNIWQAERG